ncbi:hypothetical protein H7Y63_03715 [Polaromonas sp.]|nr:hypothetical protein [Candidatus Saccharibacteria bacterium]
MNNINTQMNQLSYDINPLSNELLFRGTRKYNKSKYVIIIPLLAAPLAVTLGLVGRTFHTDIFTKLLAYSQIGLIAFVFASLPFVYIWGSWLRPYFYRKGLTKFALANDLYDADEDEIKKSIPQSLNSYTDSREVTGLTMPVDNGKVVIMDFSFSVGEGKSKRDYEYAIAALHFQKSFPHLYLDGRANGLNDMYSSSQQVQLEGNFNEFFRLYIPKGSSAGSLTILSPDIMQTLIDFGTPFDIEINGQSVAIISPGKAFTKAMIPKLLLCADAIYKEFTQLEKSWKPVYNLHGKKFDLEVSNYGKTILWIMGATTVYILAVTILD